MRRSVVVHGLLVCLAGQGSSCDAFVLQCSFVQEHGVETRLFVRVEDFAAGPIRPALPYRGLPRPGPDDYDDPGTFLKEKSLVEVKKEAADSSLDNEFDEGWEDPDVWKSIAAAKSQTTANSVSSAVEVPKQTMLQRPSVEKAGLSSSPLQQDLRKEKDTDVSVSSKQMSVMEPSPMPTPRSQNMVITIPSTAFTSKNAPLYAIPLLTVFAGRQLLEGRKDKLRELEEEALAQRVARRKLLEADGRLATTLFVIAVTSFIAILTGSVSLV